MTAATIIEERRRIIQGFDELRRHLDFLQRLIENPEAARAAGIHVAFCPPPTKPTPSEQPERHNDDPNRA